MCFRKKYCFKNQGETRRSYLYTKDAAMAVLTVLVKGKISEVYNAANEKRIVLFMKWLNW